MKILLTDFSPARKEIGDRERLIVSLVLALQEKSHEIRVLLRKGPLLECLKRQGIQVRPLNPFNALGILGEELAAFRPDLVHSHHPLLGVLGERFLRQKAGFVHTEHYPYPSLWMPLKPLGRVNVTRSSLIPQLARQRGLAASRISAIPATAAAFRTDLERLEAIRRRHEKQKGGMAVFCAAFPENGVFSSEALLEAWDLLPDSVRGRLLFFIAGQGEKEHSLRKKTEQRGLSAHFVFLEAASEEAEYLVYADFLLLPEPLWETPSLVALQAWSAAKPVLTAGTLEPPPWTVPGETGLHAVQGTGGRSLSEGLTYFLTHPVDAFHMGRQAYELWEAKYSIRIMAEYYEEFYRQVLEEGI